MGMLKTIIFLAIGAVIFFSIISIPLTQTFNERTLDFVFIPKFYQDKALTKSLFLNHPMFWAIIVVIAIFLVFVGGHIKK